MARRKPVRHSPAQAEEIRRREKLDALFALPPFGDPRIKGDFRIWEGDDRDREAIVRGIQKFTDDLVAAGPEACRRYLAELGTHNEDGTLTKEFGGAYTTKQATGETE